METLSSSKILFESKAVAISWNEVDRFLHVEWKGYSGNAEYLDILAKQLDFTKKKQAAKILYDLRKMGVVSADNQKYTNETYFPEMAKAGSTYAAIVIPENIFGEASVNTILGKKNEALFDAKLFKDTTSAVNWLRSI